MQNDRRVARRAALKAGLGAGVTAATWSAPKLESLQLVPDYAAASTHTFDLTCTSWTRFLLIDNTDSYPTPTPPFVEPLGIALDAARNIYVADGDGKRTFGFRPDGTQFLTIASSNRPTDVAVDAAGNVYVVDEFSLSKYQPSGAFFPGHSTAIPCHRL